MSFRLSLEEPVPDALRWVAIEQLEDAVRLLRDERAGNPAEAIHGVRKNLKKTRSLLRLARPDMPAKAYRRENDFLRDTARSIAAARDADVMVETVDELSERFAGQLPERPFSALRAQLAEEAGRGQAQLSGEVVDRLNDAVARVEAWEVDRCDEETLRTGAARAYKRSRRAFAAARRDPSVERLHDWRKRVKDLWYHQRLLEEAWPVPLKAHADESHRLSDLLGDDHDLAVLGQRLTATSDLVTTPPPVDEGEMLELIARRRTELQHEAMQLGQRVYSEKPKAYRRRLKHYLAAADADAGVTTPG
jgi:CHAD domain-containing protein